MTIQNENSSEKSVIKNRMLLILTWFTTKFIWPLLFILVGVCLIVITLSSMDFRGYATPEVLKRQLEVAHPILLMGFIAVSLWGWVIKKNNISKYLAIMGSAFLIREIHFEGADYIMGVILIILFGYIWKKPECLNDFWKDRWALSLLMMCFISYFCSELLFDRALLQQPFELYFNNEDWELPYSSNIEESLETLGGAFLLSSSICVLRRRNTDTA